MRATRVGGSFSSSARAFGAPKLKRPAKNRSMPEAALTGERDRLHDESPVFGLDVGRCGLLYLMRRSGRWERNIEWLHQV